MIQSKKIKKKKKKICKKLNQKIKYGRLFYLKKK
jgi:hypothetical protein